MSIIKGRFSNLQLTTTGSPANAGIVQINTLMIVAIKPNFMVCLPLQRRFSVTACRDGKTETIAQEHAALVDSLAGAPFQVMD